MKKILNVSLKKSNFPPKEKKFLYLPQKQLSKRKNFLIFASKNSYNFSEDQIFQTKKVSNNHRKKTIFQTKNFLYLPEKLMF